MNGIQIEINGEPYQGAAYQAGNGILIHLPGVQASHAPAFETLFQPLPEDHLNSGFLEVGEWDGKAFPFESDVLFGLGPDGAVWAKVCDTLDALPGVELAASDQELAWRILDEAEEAFKAKSLARERAVCGNWPMPSTIPDYLFWIEFEAKIQDQKAADSQVGSSLEQSECFILAKALHGVAGELRQLGFSPSPDPWSGRRTNESR